MGGPSRVCGAAVFGLAHWLVNLQCLGPTVLCASDALNVLYSLHTNDSIGGVGKKRRILIGPW